MMMSNVDCGMLPQYAVESSGVLKIHIENDVKTI